VQRGVKTLEQYHAAKAEHDRQVAEKEAGRKQTQKPATSKFVNFKQEAYDFSEIEKKAREKRMAKEEPMTAEQIKEAVRQRKVGEGG
jgi:peroxiredoxin family protein